MAVETGMPMNEATDPRATQHQTMDDFENELARYERLLDQLRVFAEPFMEQGTPGDPHATPEEAPKSPLHMRILRLRNLNHQFAELNARLRP